MTYRLVRAKKVETAARDFGTSRRVTSLEKKQLEAEIPKLASRIKELKKSLAKASAKDKKALELSIGGLNAQLADMKKALKSGMTTMLATETAADAGDKWWKSLTKDQQKQYIKLHPNSKYAKKREELRRKANEFHAKNPGVKIPYLKREDRDKPVKERVRILQDQMKKGSGIAKPQHLVERGLSPEHKKALRELQSDLKEPKANLQKLLKTKAKGTLTGKKLQFLNEEIRDMKNEIEGIQSEIEHVMRGGPLAK